MPVPFCEACGAPLPRFPAPGNPVKCDFCGVMNYSKLEAEAAAEAEFDEEHYYRIYQEYINLTKEYPNVHLLGDEISKLQVDLKVGLNSYPIILVLEKFPDSIYVDYNKDVRKLIGKPDYLATIAGWTPSSSSVDVIREIEEKIRSEVPTKVMEEIAEELTEEERILKDFRTEKKNKKETIVYLKGYKEEYPVKLKRKGDRYTIDARGVRDIVDVSHIIKNYENKKEGLLSTLYNMESEVYKATRIENEIKVLEANFLNVKYYKTRSKIELEIPATNKKYSAEVNLPAGYPNEPPEVEIKTSMENKLKSEVERVKKYFKDKWNPYFTLVDVLSEINGKMILQ